MDDPRDIAREDEGQRVLDEDRAWDHALAKAYAAKLQEDAERAEAENDFEALTKIRAEESQ